VLRRRDAVCPCVLSRRLAPAQLEHPGK
jgi:hypothetical protein